MTQGRACALAASLLVLPVMTAEAASRVSISAAQVDFPGLQIQQLDARWKSDGQVAVRAGRVSGISATGPLARLSVDCANLTISGDTLKCEGGRLSGTLGSLGDQDTRFTARRQADGSLRLNLDSFALAGGQAVIQIKLDGSHWEIESDLQALDLEAVAKLAQPWLELPEGFAVAAAVGGTARARGREDNIAGADLSLAFEQLDFADQAGTLAGEAVSAQLTLALLADTAGSFRAGGKLVLTGGQAYSDPLFLDFGVNAMDLEFDGILSADGSRFEASAFALDHHGVAQVSGSATLDLLGDTLLTQARTRIAAVHLATALPAYVQPYLLSTAFKDIQGAGAISGEADIDEGLPSRLELKLDDVALDSQTGSLFVAGLSGSFSWFDEALRNELGPKVDSEVFKSYLAWREARLWGIEFGAAEIPFTTTGNHFRLLDPVLLPIFDGGLLVETLRIRHAGAPQMYVRFDAELQPISVAQIGRAMGWPEFSGKLSGRIPRLELADGLVTLGGNIEASVFDGSIVIRDLKMREPLGKFPRLFASIDIDNLDLERVTNTFSFGMMTGRLSGKVEGLETFNWMPEAFDARFHTTPGDKSPHRISQRAVANLSSIGGGSGGAVTAALQAGVMRFFDTFRYDRIGLSCVLVNDVCQMDGVAKAGAGYYIVKGSGIPRIDVIGSQKRVAWRRLVAQLSAIIDGQAPVIQ